MSVTDPVWTTLTRTYGRKAVMNPLITDATLDAETARQVGEIFPLIRAELRGDERNALDYGCGAGRFTPHIADLVSGPTFGFDTCLDIIEQRTANHPRVKFITGDADRFFDPGRIYWQRPDFDLVFTAMVLGDPNLDLPATATGLASILAPGGTLVVLDHMTDEEPTGRWWRFRPEQFYRDLFNRYGISLRKIGMVRQLDDPITILAGRKS